MSRAWGWLAAFLVLAGVTTACQEELTAPAVCPELCPGGNARVFDTVLTPRPDADSSYTGYVPRHRAGSMLVSNGLPAGDARAVYRFQARRDSAPVGDSARPYVVDSVQISLNLIRRDTLLDGLNFYVYRIDPATADSEATFASITSQFVPEAIIDSIHVPDTLDSGLVRTVLRGADVAKVALPVEGDGVLAIGVAMSAPEPSGARLGALLAQSGPSFISYVTVDTPDTGTIRKQTLTAQTAFNTYVLAAPQTPDPEPADRRRRAFLAGAAPVRPPASDQGLGDDRAGDPGADSGCTGDRAANGPAAAGGEIALRRPRRQVPGRDG